MQPVYIKTSFRRILLQYLKVFLLASPFALAYILNGVSRKHDLFFYFVVLYYAAASFLFIFDFITNYGKILLEVNSEGLKIIHKEIIKWENIVDCRIFTEQKKGHSMKRGTEIIEKHFIKINEEKYDFTTYYTNFSNEEILEKIEDFRKNNKK